MRKKTDQRLARKPLSLNRVGEFVKVGCKGIIRHVVRRKLPFGEFRYVSCREFMLPIVY